MTMADPMEVIANGIMALMNLIQALIPTWQSMAQAMTHTVQAISQIVVNTGQPQPIHITVQQAPTTIQVPLPDEYKGAKDKAAHFI